MDKLNVSDVVVSAALNHLVDYRDTIIGDANGLEQLRNLDQVFEGAAIALALEGGDLSAPSVDQRDAYAWLVDVGSPQALEAVQRRIAEQVLGGGWIRSHDGANALALDGRVLQLKGDDDNVRDWPTLIGGA